MGCAGNPVIETPHLDRLANEGVRFDRAYCAFPLCCPWRASFMTGKYPHANGMYANHYAIPLGQEFLAEILAASGYRTGYIGKWHLNGGPKSSPVAPGRQRLGFDHFVGFSRGHVYDRSIFYRDDGLPRTSRRFEPDYQTDHLLESMEECRGEAPDRPFFAMVCYGIPHPPLIAPPHYLDLYSPEAVPITGAVPPECEGQARDFLAKYYGLVSQVDDNVGRVLDWLDANGLADDTVVVFVSDHGDMAGEHGRFGKKTFYEGSMRVPMLIRHPRHFPAGHVVGSLVDPSVDTMPTLLELCGAPVPECVQGHSYASLLEGGQEPIRTAVHYEICREEEGPEAFPVAERGVRTLEWLYVRTEEKPLALFDLVRDPLEMSNLLESRDHVEVVERLDGVLQAHMEHTGDDWAVAATFPPEGFQTHADGDRCARQLHARAIVEA